MKGQKTLEINPRHPLVRELRKQVRSRATARPKAYDSMQVCAACDRKYLWSESISAWLTCLGRACFGHHTYQ